MLLSRYNQLGFIIHGQCITMLIELYQLSWPCICSYFLFVFFRIALIFLLWFRCIRWVLLCYSVPIVIDIILSYLIFFFWYLSYFNVSSMCFKWNLCISTFTLWEISTDVIYIAYLSTVGV